MSRPQSRPEANSKVRRVSKCGDFLDKDMKDDWFAGRKWWPRKAKATKMTRDEKRKEPEAAKTAEEPKAEEEAKEEVKEEEKKETKG
jgi:hypothetical protein